MSGIEIVGLLLGAFPLIISGLEHWRDVAKVGGFFWRIRAEYNECHKDVLYHELLYKQNLKELLFPILNDADEANRLVSNPNDEGWSSGYLQEAMKLRLQNAYGSYIDTIRKMNITTIEFRKELSLDKPAVQTKLSPSDPKRHQRMSIQPPSKTSILATAKSKWDYETFRLKFSFNEQVRQKLLTQLETCNQRLEKLLSKSDKAFALQNTTPSNARPTSDLEALFKKAWKKSDLLFKALQRAWNCQCQDYHFANLRLEHRTLAEICFEIILVSVTSPCQATIPWSWKELECGQMIGCSFRHNSVKLPTAIQASSRPSNCHLAAVQALSTTRQNKIAFKPSQDVPIADLSVMIDPNFKLCQLLSINDDDRCMGVIGYDNETYHLHPVKKRKQPDESGLLTLDCILSTKDERHLTRRQRYFVALLLASSIAQLQFTPWLRSGLTKQHIVFFPHEDDFYSIPYHEPFIRQGFSLLHFTSPDAEANNRNFYSLGILLLELCFGQRLEDHPLRKKYATIAGEDEQALDLAVALRWSQNVYEEGGSDYASAVRWCFSTGMDSGDNSWRGEIIRNVIRPLEACQEHFKATAMLVNEVSYT